MNGRKDFEYIWHLRDKTIDESIVITIVAREIYVDLKGKNAFSYGLSFCSPKDQFCRAFGRDRARVHSHLQDKLGFYGKVEVTQNKLNRSNVLFVIASNVLVSHPNLPHNSKDILLDVIMNTQMIVNGLNKKRSMELNKMLTSKYFDKPFDPFEDNSDLGLTAKQRCNPFYYNYLINGK